MDKLVTEDDYKHFIERPDPSFSPQRNKAIIQETIKETEKFFSEVGSKINDELADRLDIVGTYGRYRFNRGTKSFDEYAGKKLMSQLIGEKILSKVRVMDSVNKLNGNDKYKDFILL